MTKRIAVLLAGLLLTAAACGNGNDDNDVGDGNGAAGGETEEVDVAMGDMFYDPEAIEVPEGTELTVNLTNEGNLEHDFVIDGVVEGDIVEAGESDTAEVGVVDEDMTAYCTVPGHREAGMEMEISAGS